MSKETKKEQTKSTDVKRPEVIQIEPKKVGYKRGEKDSTFRKGGKNGRRE